MARRPRQVAISRSILAVVSAGFAIPLRGRRIGGARAGPRLS